jgi:hypothetical protein
LISAAFDLPPLSIRELREAERKAWSVFLEAARDMAEASNPDQAPDAAREQLAAARLNLAHMRHATLDEQLQAREGLNRNQNGC